MRLSIACEKRKDELKNFLSKYGCQKATKKGKPSKIRCLYRRQEVKKAATPKRLQTTGQPHQGAAALLYILSAITADHIFSKSSEFFRMDPTSLRWMNRGSKC